MKKLACMAIITLALVVTCAGCSRNEGDQNGVTTDQLAEILQPVCDNLSTLSSDLVSVQEYLKGINENVTTVNQNLASISRNQLIAQSPRFARAISIDGEQWMVMVNEASTGGYIHKIDYHAGLIRMTVDGVEAPVMDAGNPDYSLNWEFWSTMRFNSSLKIEIKTATGNSGKCYYSVDVP